MLAIWLPTTVWLIWRIWLLKGADWNPANDENSSVVVPEPLINGKTDELVNPPTVSSGNAAG